MPEPKSFCAMTPATSPPFWCIQPQSAIDVFLTLIDELLSEPSSVAQSSTAAIAEPNPSVEEITPEPSQPQKPLPVIRVYDYEQLRQEYGL